MSKYAIAKQQLQLTAQAAKEAGMDPNEVLEALIVTAIQDLIAASGGGVVRNFLQYELDNVSTDIGIDLQRR